MSESTRANSEDIKDELEVVRANNGGILYPSAVVAFAEDEEAELHKRFNWDNDSAGYQYRLCQARNLIRVVVDVAGSKGDAVEYGVYVSLSTDRKDSGYRSTRDVYAEDELRKTLLADAKRDMQRFADKYKFLKELEKVFDAMENVA